MKELIAAIGIIFTFLLGVWNLVVNYRNSRKITFINTVTTERVKWLDKLRKNISEFCGLTYTWAMSDDKEKLSDKEFYQRIDNLRHLIKLQLNPKGELDNMIEDLLDKIPNLTHESQRDKLKAALNTLTKTSQKLLKEEWDKVKLESKRGDLRDNEHFLEILMEKFNIWCLKLMGRYRKTPKT